MPKFTDIYGQDAIKEHLQKAIETNQISHAYILSGEKNAGKEFIAKVFAQALQCEEAGAKPCGQCHSCIQAESMNHPDIIYVMHEKPNTIGVDDIRDQVNATVMVKPFQNDRKIYIIPEGEKMTQQAQNALLKTLEEPPAYVTIIILTDNAEAFLPTILSRCVQLKMRPVDDEQVITYLKENLSVSSEQARVCAAFARGNIGRAKKLAVSEEFYNIKNEVLILLKNVVNMDLYEMIQAIKKISEYQMDVNDYLDLMAIFYRDVLLFKATNDVNHLIFKDEIQYIRKVADRSTYEGMEEILESLDKSKRRLDANVNFELTMELLLSAIKDNQFSR